MNIVFLGTPDFSVPTLDAIFHSKHNILAVVTQPDKERGRGHEVTFSPVKKYAVEKGIKVFQFKKIRVDGVEELKKLCPDVMVTCAYGQILSQEIIDIPKYGIINVHASLLPKYRGSAPINWAIINGEERTGITLMRTTAGIDCGDMLDKIETKIGDEETAGELFDRLSTMGGKLLLDNLDKIENGTAKFVPQDEQLASHFPMFKKDAGKIDFDKTATEVKNFVRGMTPFPTAYLMYEGNKIKVFSVAVTENSTNAEAGEVIQANPKDGLIVACKSGAVEILELQFPNSKRATAKAFLNGREIKLHTKF